jgi:Flp pilus assembly secretin CpaC
MSTRMKIVTAVLCAVFATPGLFLIKSRLTKPHRPTNLELRTFKVEPVIFFQVIKITPDSDQANNNSRISLAARDFFKTLGVDLTAPGRSIFFNSRLGLLFVKATGPELNTVERAIQALAQVAPQIHITVRFIEVPEPDVEQVMKSGTAAGANANYAVEIIPADKMKALLTGLESDNATTLAEPEVVTISGRHAQMRAPGRTDIINDGDMF